MMSNSPAVAAHFMSGIDKGRGFLIVLILALCMGCMLATEAIGAGGEKQFGESVRRGDPTEIVVAPGVPGPALNDAAVQSFQQIEGVQGATGAIIIPMRISIGGYRAESLDVTAVDPYALRGRLAFETGGLFAADAESPQIVLGYGAQTKFANSDASRQVPASSQNTAAEPAPPPVDWLGQGAQISVAGAQNRIYTANISGILQEDKSDRNAYAFMSLTTAKKMLRENYADSQSLGLSPDSYAQAYVFTKDIRSVRAVEDAISGMGYSAQSDVPDLDDLQKELSLRRTLLAVIEGFSAAVAVLSVLCVLLSGGRKTPLPDAAALGFLGGLAAVLLACFFALIVNTSSAETVIFGLRFGQSSNLAIPVPAALITVGVSTAAVLSVGWIPMNKTR